MKLKKFSIVACASVVIVAICVFTFVASNVSDKPGSNYQIQSSEIAALSNDAKEDLSVVQSSGDSQIRYVDNNYSSEIVESMQQIQKSCNEESKNSVNNTQRYGVVSPFATNAFIQNNEFSIEKRLNATETIYWKLDGTTLHISGSHSEYPNSFNSAEVPTWKNTNVFFNINDVYIDDVINPVSCSKWFGIVDTTEEKSVPLPNIKNINNLNNLNMEGVTDANYMFAGCDWLENVTTSNMPINMNSVQNMQAMFALTVFPSDVYSTVISKLTTINNAKYAFSNDSNVTEINLSSWKVNDSSILSYIFVNDSSLKTINCEGNTDWSIIKATSDGMFKGCTSLKGGKGTEYKNMPKDSRDTIAFAQRDKGETSPGYFTHDYSKDNGYMVCIYDIDKTSKTVTFGPATGASNACLSINKYAEHDHDKSNNHCISYESWDEIIKNINEGHGADYEECMNAGCTHAVDLNLNETIRAIGQDSKLNSQTSSLHNSINAIYRKWNNSQNNIDCETTDWATCRMRATLNGKNDMSPSVYAGTDCLNSYQCLFNCFPDELKNAIVAKKHEIPTEWKNNPSYVITKSVEVLDKLWLPNGTEIFGYTYDTGWGDFGAQMQKKAKEDVIKNPSLNKVYNELGNSVARYNRSPYLQFNHIATFIKQEDGNISGKYGCTWDNPGISPCFCLSAE